MLEGVEETAKDSIQLINEIQTLMENTKEKLSTELPKLYSKDLLELLFSHPYTKIGFLVDKLGITRKTATSYLRAIEEIGILQSVKVSRDVYYINTQLFMLLKNK